MRYYLVFFTLIFQIFGISSFIVPDEIPTILSVIYSNIPVIKKGTDSRIGWGFRLGNRADFQILVELGPQTNTQPLGNQGDSGTSKRNTVNNLSNTLYAQRQKDEQIDSDGGKWLENWSKSIQPKKKVLPPKARPGIAVGEIDAKSVIPDDSDLERSDNNVHPAMKLAELYAQKQESVETTTEEIESSTLKDAA